MLAYAAGDALGVPWEGQPPSAISWEAIDRLPTRGEWPAGATSDDTEQLVPMAGYVAELGDAGAYAPFRDRYRDMAKTAWLRGAYRVGRGHGMTKRPET
jgi:ADP-ribosyl-[dinitrogen reductase] hydrolase